MPKEASTTKGPCSGLQQMTSVRVDIVCRPLGFGRHWKGRITVRDMAVSSATSSTPCRFRKELKLIGRFTHLASSQKPTLPSSTAG